METPLEQFCRMRGLAERTVAAAALEAGDPAVVPPYAKVPDPLDLVAESAEAALRATIQ